MTDYAFGELTRTLYDAIWSEFCDWGLELAKVRLGDASLPDADREATWWTLVEALDTYLRLLHPVMPFVTEELWAALPHRADDASMLIVADWPVAGQRDVAAEAAVSAVIDTIVEIRNARATARVPAGAWLETHVAAGGDETAFVALAPAVERLARARPLHVHGAADALPRGAGTLDIVLPAGGVEAVVLTGAAAEATDSLDRGRLEKELAEAEAFLAAARARLANDAFVSKAPQSVVEGARTRETELAETVGRLRERLGR
jgi:valyl-tRNA synthetase